MVKKKKEVKEIKFIKILEHKFPDLKFKLRKARLNQSPYDYLLRTTIASFYLSLGISFIFFLFTKSIFSFLAFPILMPLMWFYYFHYADVVIAKEAKKIFSEIVYVGRFLIVELSSGFPIYEAFKNVAINFENTGKYFYEIINNISLGYSIESALEEAMELSPSEELRKIFWQVYNSITTGSDVVMALTSLIDQISRKQQIEIKEYGKKLNPLAMFYLASTIIFPSLGIVLFTVFSIFTGISLGLIEFFSIAFLILILQSGFLFAIKNMRPPLEM